MFSTPKKSDGTPSSRRPPGPSQSFSAPQGNPEPLPTPTNTSESEFPGPKDIRRMGVVAALGAMNDEIQSKFRGNHSSHPAETVRSFIDLFKAGLTSQHQFVFAVWDQYKPDEKVLPKLEMKKNEADLLQPAPREGERVIVAVGILQAPKHAPEVKDEAEFDRFPDVSKSENLEISDTAGKKDLDNKLQTIISPLKIEAYGSIELLLAHPSYGPDQQAKMIVREFKAITRLERIPLLALATNVDKENIYERTAFEELPKEGLEFSNDEEAKEFSVMLFHSD
ncbi:MAG: hypothetical protein M4579_000800 [Chaenotheca gracillima]|nr:MAG: hypothetical protein M4579_000800 [Chaenotheca gracillima]